MPELPEVQTIINGLQQEVRGQIISHLEIRYENLIKGSAKEFKETVEDSKIIDFSRRGKYIFWHLEKNNSIYYVVTHLRMTGQLFLISSSYEIDKHSHLIFSLKNENKKILYRDIRKFGGFEIIDISPSDYLNQKKIATDALIITKKEFQQNLQKRNKALKIQLLDQRIIAGLGNIYVDESLMRAHLSPFHLSGELTEIEIENLLSVIKNVLQSAIFKGGTTFSDYVNSYGEKGTFQLELLAYKQTGKPCPYCGTAIIRTRLGGRGTHYCPYCQK